MIWENSRRGGLFEHRIRGARRLAQIDRLDMGALLHIRGGLCEQDFGSRSFNRREE
jgi:hypothetical protein